MHLEASGLKCVQSNYSAGLERRKRSVSRTLSCLLLAVAIIGIRATQSENFALSAEGLSGVGAGGVYCGIGTLGGLLTSIFDLVN